MDRKNNKNVPLNYIMGRGDEGVEFIRRGKRNEIFPVSLYVRRLPDLICINRTLRILTPPWRWTQTRACTEFSI